ncbi:MAG: cache domain-containing protein [Gammaproteobacteria bacterium]
MTATPAGQDDTSFDVHLQSVVDLSRKMMANVVDTAEQITRINRATRILSMNARVEAARAGAAGAGFGVVAEELTRLSGDISSASSHMLDQSRRLNADLDGMIANLSTRVRDARLCDLALTNIDIIDRNLYERSCDVRWWAADVAVGDCLARPTRAARDLASRRLSQILDTYTVYFDLIVADLEGRIVANGRSARYQVEGALVGDTEWFQSALATRDGTQFAFQSAHPSKLVNGQRALIYSSVIREGGSVNGRPLGVLGTLLAWDNLGQTVVKRTPLSRAEWGTTRVCIIDGQGTVLADSASEAQGILDFPERTALLANARSAVDANLDGRAVRVAHAASPGFETYRTGWHSLLIRRLDRGA